ncbi:hypothetical protein PAL_GLEAN10002613 [Pteropus alecto]|uniref:Uncharacterized protein n=1 Tax=Pteropus alecto TaxID=9402 RepID=L5KXR6_PTEAL|nr:hypothetical protein PAL_GLEAN10002613 [Pteropus alecto]
MTHVHAPECCAPSLSPGEVAAASRGEQTVRGQSAGVGSVPLRDGLRGAAAQQRGRTQGDVGLSDTIRQRLDLAVLACSWRSACSSLKCPDPVTGGVP